VPDHVAVGEVDQDKAIDIFLDRVDDGVCNLIGTHGRFLIVGGDLRRRDQDLGFADVGIEAATVEKIGHVWVLLGFGAMELTQALFAERFA